MKRVRVGAVGAGRWAIENHFPQLVARDDVDLVALCGRGPDLESIRARFGFASATDEYEALLEQDLDAVVISTPHDLHYSQAVAAISRGLHVMCEKPMTLSAADAWDLVERVENSGTHFLVPYGWNYKPFSEEARRLIKQGAIGDIRHVTCSMASPTIDLFKPSAEHSTWTTPAAGGGYAHGQLTHAVALFLWITGLRSTRISAVTTSSRGIDLYDAGIVTFENGAHGVVSGAATLPTGSRFQIEIRVFGTSGTLILDVETDRLEVLGNDGRRTIVPIEPGSGDYECVTPPHRFIDLITGVASDNNSPAELGAWTVSVLEALLESANHGGAVTDIPGPVVKRA